MGDKEWFHELMTRRIKPVDGMAVTAQVWEEAHELHRQQLRFHDQSLHGEGIVAGLEVIASDPPDSSVYVLPGVALDALGRLILVPEPVAYDLGLAYGPVALVLTYDEGRPAPDGEREDSPLYVHSQFNIEVTPVTAAHAGVELARLNRREREAALRDAGDAQHPAANEIDLRFRRPIGVVRPRVASLAVCYTGGLFDAGPAHGADHLARYLARSGCPANVDDRVPLAAGLDQYDLLYLVGRDAFQLSRDEMGALYAYLQGGGTLLFESCRQGMEGEPPADAALLDLLASMGISLRELPAGHDLLAGPNLFATAPAGFDTREGAGVWVADNVIVSNVDYGCLWQGRRRGRPAARDEIRAAQEWGHNLVAYALGRRK